MGAEGIVRKLTKLEGVNIILRGAREHPVSSLDTDKINESLLALQVLNEWLLQEQAKGLFNNTFERDFVAATAVDGDVNVGDIVLPINTLYATPWGQDLRLLADPREDKGILKLFNLEDETFDFTTQTEVTIRLVLCIEWDQLSPLQQRSIADQAAQEYQMDVHGSNSMDQKLTQRAGRSRAEARAENMRKMRPNLFNNSRSNLGRAGVRGVLRPYWPEGDGRLNNRRV